jgi:hypothetical protein
VYVCARAYVCDAQLAGRVRCEKFTVMFRGPKHTSEVYRPLGASRVTSMLPHGTHGVYFNLKIARSLRFEMIQFPVCRLRRPRQLGSREKVIESS